MHHHPPVRTCVRMSLSGTSLTPESLRYGRESEEKRGEKRGGNERESQAFSYETEGLVVFVNKKLDQ